MRTFDSCFIAVLLSFAWTPLQAEERSMTLSVDDPRPVAEVVLKLESQYGWAITYEDPRYVHADDLADVTYRVRRDLGDFPMARAPKVLIPRGGPLTVTYNVSSDTGMPSSAADLIQTALNVHAAGAGASFRLLQSGSALHVVPARVRNRSGQLEEQGSLLDAAITLPPEERDGVEALEAICHAVAASTQTRVSVGAIPLNLLRRNRSTQTVLNSVARDVLTQTLAYAGGKLSWQLLYDPGLDEYFLNLHPVVSQ